jgi:hypothetical protein
MLLATEAATEDSTVLSMLLSTDLVIAASMLFDSVLCTEASAAKEASILLAVAILFLALV